GSRESSGSSHNSTEEREINWGRYRRKSSSASLMAFSPSLRTTALTFKLSPGSTMGVMSVISVTRSSGEGAEGLVGSAEAGTARLRAWKSSASAPVRRRSIIFRATVPRRGGLVDVHWGKPGVEGVGQGSPRLHPPLLHRDHSRSLTRRRWHAA